MKFRSVPAIITLLAAFVSSVVMISRRYSLFDFLLVLATVLVVFYVAGLFLRFILNVVFKEQEKDKDDADEDGTVTESEADEKEEKKSKDRKK